MMSGKHPVHVFFITDFPEQVEACRVHLSEDEFTLHFCPSATLPPSYQNNELSVVVIDLPRDGLNTFKRLNADHNLPFTLLFLPEEELRNTPEILQSGVHALLPHTAAETNALFTAITIRRAADMLAAGGLHPSTDQVLSHLTENLLDMICEMGPDGVLKYASPSHLTSLGWRPEDLVGQHYSKFIHPDDASYVNQWFKRLFDGEKIDVIEYRVMNSAGLPVWYEGINRILNDSSGRPSSLIISHRDISRRKQEELLLKQQALAFANMFDAVIITDSDERVTHWNPAAERLYGYTQEEMLGRSKEMLHHPALDPATHALMHATLLQNGRWNGRIPFVRKDGSQGVSEVMLVAMKDDANTVTHIIDVQRDITKQVEAEKALHRRNEILNAISVVSAQLLVSFDWKDCIKDTLRQLGMAAGVGRVLLFANHRDAADTPVCSLLYEWHDEEEAPIFGNPNLFNLPLAKIAPTWYEKLARGESIPSQLKHLPINIEANCPPESANEAIVMIPILVDAVFWGLLFYSEIKQETEWPEQVVEALKTTATILGGAIQRKDIRNALQRRLDMQQLTISLTGQLINLSEETFVHEIQGTLQALAEFSGASRCFLRLIDENTLTIASAFEWAAAARPLFAGEETGVSLRKFPWLLKELNGKNFIVVPVVKDLPAEAEREVRHWVANGVQSVIIASLSIGERLVGYYGFTAEGDVRQWGEDEQLLLRMMGNVYAGLLDRLNLEKSRSQSEARFRSLFESSPVGLWDEDLSEVYQYIQGLKRRGVQDIRAYLHSHPQDVNECASKIRVLRFNQAAVHTQDMETPDEFLDELSDILVRGPNDLIIEELAAIYEGRLTFEDEGLNDIINGEYRYQSVRYAVVAGSEHTFDRVIVSISDVTARKRMENALQVEQKQLLSIFDSIDLTIYVADMDTYEILYANPAAQRMVGKPLMGGICYQEIHDSPEICAFCTNSIIRKNPGMAHRWEFYNSALKRTFLATDKVIRWPDGRDVRFQVSIDITARKQSEEELRQANQQLSNLVKELEERNQQSRLMNEMGDLLQSCVRVEQAYQVVQVFCPQLLPGTSGLLYIFDENKQMLEEHASWGDPQADLVIMPNSCWGMRRGQVSGVDHPGDVLRCKHVREGLPYLCIPVAAQGDLFGLLHVQGDPEDIGRFHQRWQVLLVSITERLSLALANLRLSETLRNQSFRDPLTGLFNRRYLEDILEREISTANRSNREVGVLMLDIDHFKDYNDTFGHDAGDILLRELGRYLQDNGGSQDVACRYGGDEMTLIFPGANRDALQEKAENIRLGVQRLNIHIGEGFLGSITVSIGGALYPSNAQSATDLLRAADRALLRAKAEGRNQTILAGG